MLSLVRPPNSKDRRVFGFLKRGQNESLVVLVPGLGDGPFSIPTLDVLDENFHELGYSTLHVNLTSSFYGSGLHGISQSALELFQILEGVEYKNYIVVGHSTGSQVTAEFAKTYGHKFSNLTLILLGAVSDRHGITVKHLIDKARELAENGKGDNLLPEMIMNFPITANRLNELTLKHGADDYFTPDLELDYLKQKYKNFPSCPVLFVYGAKDKYMSSADDYKALIDRINTAINGDAKFAVVDGDHYFNGHALELFQKILAFLKTILGRNCLILSAPHIKSSMYTLVRPTTIDHYPVFGMLKKGKNGSLAVIIPGFADGFFTSAWQLALDEKLHSSDYSVLHIHLSSSFYGCGLHSTAKSASELSQIVDSVKFESLILIAHSAGCRIALEFAKTFGQKYPKLYLVLLAAVNGRLSDNDPTLIEVKNMINSGKGEWLLQEMHGSVPVTANRLYQLSARHGEDDYFSTDSDLDYLKEKYRNLESYPILFLYGDPYISDLNGYRNLVDKITKEINPKAKFKIIEGDHCFRGHYVTIFQEIVRFIK